MLEFLVDNIFVLFAKKVFLQTVGIPIWVPIVPPFFCWHLYVLIQSVFHTVFALKRKATVSYSVQSNLQVHRWCVVHKQTRIQKLSWSDVSCWNWDHWHHGEYHFFFLPIFTTVDWEGWLTHTSIYDERDDFNYYITNFPFMSSNIPSSPAYCVFISQFIHYDRAYSSYECFILRARRLSRKLIKQGYIVEHLKSSFRKFYSRYVEFVQQYEVSFSRMLNEILTLDHQWLPSRSDIPHLSWAWYRAWPSRKYEWFPWSIRNGCSMTKGNPYPSGYLAPFPFWDCLCSYCLDQIPRISNVFTRIFTLNIPWFFLDFAHFKILKYVYIYVINFNNYFIIIHYSTSIRYRWPSWFVLHINSVGVCIWFLNTL